MIFGLETDCRFQIGDFLSLRLKIGCDTYFSIPSQITVH
jgi:hypothetical protein